MTTAHVFLIAICSVGAGLIAGAVIWAMITKTEADPINFILGEVDRYGEQGLAASGLQVMITALGSKLDAKNVLASMENAKLLMHPPLSEDPTGQHYVLTNKGRERLALYRQAESFRRQYGQ